MNEILMVNGNPKPIRNKANKRAVTDEINNLIQMTNVWVLNHSEVKHSGMPVFKFSSDESNEVPFIRRGPAKSRYLQIAFYY